MKGAYYSQSDFMHVEDVDIIVGCAVFNHSGVVVGEQHGAVASGYAGTMGEHFAFSRILCNYLSSSAFFKQSCL